MSHLVPCEGCRRHVRCGEGPCPFCGAAVADAPAPPLPDRALSRAALFVFASSVALGAACKSTSDQGPGAQPVVQTRPDTSQVALYGAPAPPAEVAPDAGGPEVAPTPPMAIYGAPAAPVEVADAGPPSPHAVEPAPVRPTRPTRPLRPGTIQVRYGAPPPPDDAEWV